MSLRRAGYILFVAYLFRSTNWLASLPRADLQELLKVDILNCMGLAMMAFSVVALFDFRLRLRASVIGALVVACAAPLISRLGLARRATVVRDYLTPSPASAAVFRSSRVPPTSASAWRPGTGEAHCRRSNGPADAVGRALRISADLQGAEYVSNLPYSVYTHSDFWPNSPALILIRVGIMLLLLAGAYLWTQYARARLELDAESG